MIPAFGGGDSGDTVKSIVTAMLTNDIKMAVELIDQLDLDEVRRTAFTLALMYTSIFEHMAAVNDLDPMEAWQSIALPTAFIQAEHDDL